MFARLFAIALVLSAVQETGVLRITVVLPEPGGNAAPVPRVLLLVSDNPSTVEPRRVRTGPDGTVELKLVPGLYTIESDQPTSFSGVSYTWTQMITVVAGQTAVLDLTVKNADLNAASGGSGSSSSALLAQWRDSVAEIWTPTTHAAGFLVDARGLVATTDRALGGHTAAEVEFTVGRERFKVPGRVIVADRATGAAFIWVNPQAIAKLQPFDLGCSAPMPAINYQDALATIGSSVLSTKEVSDGIATKVTSQAIFSNMRIGDDAAGGPVFGESGNLVGISSIDDPAQLRRWNDAWVVPLERVCEKVEVAIAGMKGAPPNDTRLPIDPPRTGSTVLIGKQKPAAATGPPASVKASSFDITIMTAQQARDVKASMANIRTDFGTWLQYVSDAPPVLMVRISPQFEEAMWKTLARGYAFLQGVWLGPFKSFTANFLRMRAYCGNSEVLPIHPFVIEHRIPDRSPIREGLYVFDLSAFGPHCKTIRFAMYSEKSPDSADTKQIDPKLFEQLPR